MSASASGGSEAVRSASNLLNCIQKSCEQLSVLSGKVSTCLLSIPAFFMANEVSKRYPRGLEYLVLQPSVHELDIYQERPCK
jgi:hypothetical protein